MADNVINFSRRQEARELKRKEEKAEALRRAFRLARGDGNAPENPEGARTAKNRKRRQKRKK